MYFDLFEKNDFFMGKEWWIAYFIEKQRRRFHHLDYSFHHRENSADIKSAREIITAFMPHVARLNNVIHESMKKCVGITRFGYRLTVHG